MNTGDRLRGLAAELGFDALAIGPATPLARASAFHAWLAAGHHAGMGWLARAPARRADPGAVLPGARSVVVVAASYFAEDPPPEFWDDPLRGRVARYAWGRDYHDELRPGLEELAAFLRRDAGATSVGYVDTGPVLEREHAARAGLGFLGRNTLLIRPDLGSFVFLGVILTTADLPPDPPAATAGAVLVSPPPAKAASCGACRRCLDACPTRAFPAPHVLDSRRCISYLTIEHRGAIPPELRPTMGRWIFGCDDCQAVCPWNRQFARPGRRRFLRFAPDRCAPRLTDLLALDEAGFRARFAGTPVLRAKRAGLRRNACIALGNSGRPEAAAALESAVADPDPLVREHAAWARERLGRAGA